MDSDTNFDNVFIGTPEALGLTHLPNLEEEQNEVIDGYPTSEEDDADFPLVEADSDSSGGEEIDIKNRTRIRPFGDSFRKSNEVLPEAYSIIKGLFTEAWISWRKVPKKRKDLWFEEFKMKFFWKDKHANAVRRNWRGKCSTFLRTTFCEARAMGKKPAWIAQTIWNEMLKSWASEDFKKLSEANKSHRAFLKGGYTGGSKNISQHVIEYEDKYNKKMTQSKLMRKVFRKKKTKKWTGTKAQIIERFNELIKAFKEAHPEGLTKEDKCRIWAEAGGHMQGSMKKAPDFRNSGTPSRAIAVSVDENQMGELRKTIEESLRKSIEEELRRSITEEVHRTTDDKIQQILLHSKQQEARYTQLLRTQHMQIQRLASFQQVHFLEPLQGDTSFTGLLNSSPNQLSQVDASFMALLNSPSPLLSSPNPLATPSTVLDTSANTTEYRNAG